MRGFFFALYTVVRLASIIILLASAVLVIVGGGVDMIDFLYGSLIGPLCVSISMVLKALYEPSMRDLFKKITLLARKRRKIIVKILTMSY
jgi:hypothetical protein